MSPEETLLRGIEDAEQNYDFEKISLWMQQRAVLDAASTILEKLGQEKRKKRVILAIILMKFDDEIFCGSLHDTRMKESAEVFTFAFKTYLQAESPSEQEQLMENTRRILEKSLEDYESWLHTDRQFLLQFELNASP